MAKSLCWADLSEAALAEISARPTDHKGQSVLAKHMHLKEYGSDPRERILLDLYVSALHHCREAAMTPEKTSTFVSIVKANHAKAVEDLKPPSNSGLTVEKSFAYFQELMVAHSAHRPPYSVGIFTVAEAKALTEWTLATYYRHYKLYQYAFTKRVTLDVATDEPGYIVEMFSEKFPDGAQFLGLALTEEEHEQKLADERAAAEEAARLAEEEAAAAAEAARLAAIEKEFADTVPEEVGQKVDAALEERLAKMKEELEAQFQAQEAALLEKIAALEAKAGA